MPTVFMIELQQLYFKSRSKKSSYVRLETLAVRVCSRLFVSHKKVLTNLGYSDEKKKMFAGSPETSQRPKLSRTNSDSVSASEDNLQTYSLRPSNSINTPVAQ